MPDTAILSKMFLDVIKVKRNIANPNSVTLKEKSNKAYSIDFVNLPNKLIVLDFDKNFRNDSYFQNTNGIRTRADYIFISPEDKRIFYIEMKYRKQELSHVACQLKGAKCFIEYCRWIGMQFWENAEFLKNYSEHYVLICRRAKDKRRTSPYKLKVSSAQKPQKLRGIPFIDYPSFVCS